MSKIKFDFGGYATKTNLKCTDGRVILKDAFKDNDGTTVPLVWQHMHSEPSNILGHAFLENREDGVYAYCTFNESESGKNAKLLVNHGDIKSLSIYANSLVEKAKHVAHGVIREISLVLAGANSGAVIDFISISHADGTIVEMDDEAIIYTGEALELKIEDVVKHEEKKEEASKETVGDVFNTLSEKQKTAVYAIIAEVAEGLPDDDDAEAQHSNLEGDTGTMKSNVFDGSADTKVRPTLTHEQFKTIIDTAHKCGSFKEAFLQHAGTYGIDNIDYLFPDAQAVTNTPTFIQRDMTWVGSVINGTYHSRFSRIKSLAADITVETARALGYVTGALKKEEVFGLLRRITTPTTIYKKQKLDRDDIVDITDLDVVAWLKAEMRMMLDEEIARAVLISDGRDVASEDKIPEANIRPIFKDDVMYAHRIRVASDDTTAEIEEAIVRGRSNYKGSGSPVMYTTTEFLTDLLLQKDGMQRRIYGTEAELAAALRVSRIIEVPVMDGVTFTDTVPDPDVVYNLLAVIVNLKDYTIGADKGGAINMFDDFDIDYNQYKYLLETRISGALTLPKSALVIEQAVI